MTFPFFLGEPCLCSFKFLQCSQELNIKIGNFIILWKYTIYSCTSAESKNYIAFSFLNASCLNRKEPGIHSYLVKFQPPSLPGYNLLYLGLPGCRMLVKSAQVTDMFISDNWGQGGELAESSSKPTTKLQSGDNTQPLQSKHTLSKLWTAVDVTLHFLNSFIWIIRTSSLMRSGNWITKCSFLIRNQWGNMYQKP